MIRPKSFRRISSSRTKALNQYRYSLNDLKEACKKNGIKNTVDYKNRYQDFLGFPAYPERVYADEWVNYSDFFDIVDFISYDELKSIIRLLQVSYSHFIRCKSLINNEPQAENREGFSLIRLPNSEIKIELEEVSYFQQLLEVCENATIYQSASAENAILPRTQIYDRMAVFNNQADLFILTEDEQLKVGNELYKLFRNRLKTWQKIDQVVNCEVRLDTLLGSEQILKSEIQLIFNPSLRLDHG